MNRPLVIYIASPYSAKTPDGVGRNVRRARNLGTYYRQRGAVCIIPHQESLGCEATMSEPEWLAHCLGALTACDVVARADDPSFGGDVECAWMHLLAKPVVRVKLGDDDEVMDAVAPSVAALRALVDAEARG